MDLSHYRTTKDYNKSSFRSEFTGSFFFKREVVLSVFVLVSFSARFVRKMFLMSAQGRGSLFSLNCSYKTKRVSIASGYV